MVYQFHYNVQFSDADSLGKLFDGFVRELLLYRRSTTGFFHKLCGETQCIQAQILCAIHCLNTGRSPKEHLDVCKRLAEHANIRERWLWEAVQFWHDARLDEAITMHTKIAEQFPQDIVSLFLCFNHYVYIHDTQSMLEIFWLVEEALADNPFFLGMYCFALSEAYHLEKARTAGEKAYDILPEAPWTHHSLCHVYQELGLIDEGINFMLNNSKCWNDCIPFMYSHNWWHVAMLYLAKCSGPQDKLLKKVEEIIDQYTWYTIADSDEKRAFNSDITVIAGIIGLLWELDLNGYSSSQSVIPQEFLREKWQSIISYVHPRTNVHIYPFFDIHFVYALARVGEMEEVRKYVSSIEQHAEEWNKNYLIDAWKKVVPAASKGIVSFVLGDYSSAYFHLEPIHNQICMLGGSNPQRLPMEETYIRSCLYTDRVPRAISYLTPTQVSLNSKGVCQYPQCYMIAQKWLASNNGPKHKKCRAALESTRIALDIKLS